MSEADKLKTLSEEHKRKISEANKGRQTSEETREKLSKSNTGKHHTKEARKKMSIGHLGIIPWIVGKHQSEEARSKMSETHKGIKLGFKHREKISEGHIGKMPKNMQKSGIQWGNVKSGYFDINGKEMFFRSKWEANYALYLDFLVKQKQILKWEYESDTFIFEKIKFGTRSYRPDFKVYDNEKDFSYHEVKGYMDAKSKTKIKRMAKYYPNTKLIIIDKDVYTDIKNKIGKMLKFN